MKSHWGFQFKFLTSTGSDNPKLQNYFKTKIDLSLKTLSTDPKATIKTVYVCLDIKYITS